MCLSDAKQSITSSKILKAYNKSDIQIAYANEKLHTIMSQLNL